MLAAMVALVLAPPARAGADGEFGISIGYAELSIDDDPVLDDLDDQGGLRFEPRFTWAPSEDLPNLRLGIGVGFSFFYDEEDSGQDFGGFADVEDFEEISFIIPEFQVTWRQPLAEHYFIEGGVGIGAVFGYFRAGQVVFDELFDQDVSEWDLALGIRPLLRGGYMSERWSAGLEGSYLFTDLDFGHGIGGNMEELYIGLFYQHKL